MPATVINGLFSDGIILWQSVGGPATFDGFACVPNTTNQTQTFTGATLSGSNPGDFTVPAGQFPVTVNPNQTALIHVSVTPPGGVSHIALVTINTNTVFAPNFQVTFNQFGTQYGQPMPSILGFPTTKVGQVSTFANYQIFNTGNAILYVTNITLTTGTDFFIVGAPIVPFNIPIGGSSAVFTIQFIPTVVGARNDILTVTGTGVADSSGSLTGIGSTLQSAFNLTGGTQGSLFALSGGGNPLILLANPNSLNTEEPGSFVRLHDWQMPNYEKKLMRIRGHYEDLGPATISFKARSRRIGEPDDVIQVPVVIGTAFADGWLREFTSEPCPLSGELIQLTCSRAANSGPVSIIDYIPEFEPAGEVIGGT